MSAIGNPSSIEQVREAIVDSIKLQLPSLRTCESHPGQFNEAEIRRVAAQAPAVFVAVLGVGKVNDTRHPAQAPVSFAIYVIAKDQPGKTRDQISLRLTNALIDYITNNDWDSDSVVEDPENIKAANLFRAVIDKQGVAMWAISFTQVIEITAGTSLSDLNDFLLAVGESTDTDDQGEDITLIESQAELEGAGNES